jgi:putative ABC transport system permease protein
VKILTVPQTLAYHQGMVDRAFAFTYAIQLLVIVVTLAGIFDLLTTQILERRREIGVLRAIGSDDWRIARAIRLEALAIGTVGALLGCLLGVGTSLLWVHVNFRILIGYVLEHHYAGLTAAWCVGLAAGVAMLAGQLAARRALRQPALEALRYE